MKLVMFDLDGTLLADMHHISEENRKALRQLYKKGYHLGVATGRRILNIEEILGEDVLYFDVLIGENGYQTKDLKTNENSFTRKLTKDEISDIVGHFDDETKDITFCYYTQEETYYSRKSPFSILMEEGLNRKVSYIDIREFPELPKLCMPVGKDLADEYRAKVESLESDTYHGAMTGFGFFEFMSKDTSKWKALEKYIQKNGYTKDDVIAFGDSGNDMEILANVGFAVAMQNADDKVKAICHAITKYPHHEDGVGKYIIDHML